MQAYQEDVWKESLEANLEWRDEILGRCFEDKGVRQGFKDRCREDILFWVNATLWTYDPRKIDEGESPHIPFITWPFQDPVILTLQKWLGKSDVGIEKSRDMGASWLCLLVFLHQWQFLPGRAFMLVSRNERLVEAPTDPDSLFWKLDYMLACQPKFLLPRFNRIKLHLENKDNGSNIDGASTTGDVGRGGRRTAILIDEYGAFDIADSQAVNAATSSNTESRIYNSTYKGATGAFYEQMQRPDIVKIRIHWSEHPEHGKGASKDPATGKWRGPWYEKMCQRIVVPALIAMELDIDPQGAASMFFPPDLLDRLMLETVRPPIMRGRLDFDPLAPSDRAKIKFVDDPNGDLKLWTLLKQDAKGVYCVPEEDAFVIGEDVSAGTGATPSVASVADKRTREKIAELVRPDLSPDRFADYCLALATFFNDAFMIWEMNGPGGTFGKRLVDQGYRNIYYRQEELGLEHKISKGLIPGWFASTNNKLLLFREYVRALSNGFFVNRSVQALADCRQYVYLPTGGVGNAKAYATADPSGARMNHGDIPTADALCNKALGPESDQKVEEKNLNDPYKPPQNAPYGSLAWRRQKWLDEQKMVNGGGWETDRLTMRSWGETPVGVGGWE